MRPSSLEDVITTVKTPALEMELNSPFPVYIIHLDHLQIFQPNDMLACLNPLTMTIPGIFF
jgi:hypothetical protein